MTSEQWRRLKRRLCLDCGARLEGDDARCPDCLEKANAATRASGAARQKRRAARNVAAGLCQCGRPRTEGKTSCPKCRAASATKADRRKERGVCRRCNEPALPGKTACAAHAADFRERANRANREARAAVFAHYGTACKCCGEATPEFLSIDHVDGGGTRHRKSLGAKSGTYFYRWLKRQGFPEGYQTLCHNCNMAKGFFGICPHERARRERAEGG